MKRFLILFLLVMLTAAALILPSHAASGTVTTACVNFGRMELPEGAMAFGAVYKEGSGMLHVARAEDRHGEICISMPMADSTEMNRAKLFILQGNTFIPLRTVTATEAPATPEPPTPSADALATVITGSQYTEVTTLAELKAAIDPSGNSAVTLHKDIDTRSLKADSTSPTGKTIITLPYSCTLDFNGHTVQTGDESGTFTAGDHGIKIAKAGTENRTATLKNGHLISYESGVWANDGVLALDNMTVDTFYGTAVAVYETDACEHAIRNSQLSSKGWGCLSFNNSNADQSATKVVIENSSLASYNMYNPGTAVSGILAVNVFVKQRTTTPGTLVFGENVDLYTHNDTYAAAEFPIQGKAITMQGRTAAVTLCGKLHADLNHWTTREAPTPSAAIATVVTGSNTVQTETLSELLAAIDPSGNSVVTLHKDIDTRNMAETTITLPYTCTVDLNGYTIRTADETFETGSHGIKIAAAGTENKTTTLKNGRLVAYNFGIIVNKGGITVDNMTIDTYYSACIGIYDTTATAHAIKNSRLSAPSWGCVSFNKSNADFSGATLTVENSSLTSYKQKSGSAILVCQSSTVPGTVKFGKNVDLYSYSSAYAKDNYTSYTGYPLTQQDKTAAVMVNGTAYTGLNHWSTEDYGYLVGFGQTDITPTQSVPLAGYGSTSNRMSTDNYTELKATAVAVTDRNGESLMFISLDLINARYSMTSEIRNGIHAATGIDPNRIMVAYSHSHSSPDLSNTSATEYMLKYIPYIVDQVVFAGLAAWNDRQSAEMEAGSITVPSLNFVRHVRRKNGDITGIGFGSSSSPIKEQLRDPDTDLRLIRFTRTDGEDVLLMNWQAHATMNSYSLTGKAIYKQTSADYVAGIRHYVETKLNCKFAYYQGGAGDLMPTSLISGQTPTRDIYEYGELLGAYIGQCLQKNMVKIAAGPIRSETFIYKGKVNHEGDSRYEDALKVNRGEATYSELGFINKYHVSSVIRCYALGEYIEERCTVLSIGAVGFAAMPHELFSDTGIQIRADSPFLLTFIMAYSNDANGYLPIRAAYDYDSYEEACTSFAKGSAEELAEVFAEKWSAICP